MEKVLNHPFAACIIKSQQIRDGFFVLAKPHGGKRSIAALTETRSEKTPKDGIDY